MTCIVGLAEQGRVLIGGDSAGANSSWALTIRADQKVFRNGPFLMGFTTSFRMGQLLQYKLQVPEQTADQTDFAFMVTTFIDAVRTCLKDGGYAKVESNAETGGVFLVGYRGNIYKVDSDFQVSQPVSGYAAVGCGDDIALGSLHATSSLVGYYGSAAPLIRVRMALEAAESLSAGVRRPFVILQDTE